VLWYSLIWHIISFCGPSFTANQCISFKTNPTGVSRGSQHQKSHHPGSVDPSAFFSSSSSSYTVPASITSSASPHGFPGNLNRQSTHAASWVHGCGGIGHSLLRETWTWAPPHWLAWGQGSLPGTDAFGRREKQPRLVQMLCYIYALFFIPNLKSRIFNLI